MSVLTDSWKKRYAYMAWNDFPCKPWTKGKDKHGYGVIQINKKRWFVHRLTWTIERGAIPRGMNVCHHCDNPPCREIEHLFLGTHADNMADRDAKGRCRAGKWNLAKTQCPQGHPYDEENTLIKNGHRVCRTCRRNWQRAWRKKITARMYEERALRGES